MDVAGVPKVVDDIEGDLGGDEPAAMCLRLKRVLRLNQLISQCGEDAEREEANRKVSLQFSTEYCIRLKNYFSPLSCQNSFLLHVLEQAGSCGRGPISTVPLWLPYQ